MAAEDGRAGAGRRGVVRGEGGFPVLLSAGDDRPLRGVAAAVRSDAAGVYPSVSSPLALSLLPQKVLLRSLLSLRRCVPGSSPCVCVLFVARKQEIGETRLERSP